MNKLSFYQKYKKYTELNFPEQLINQDNINKTNISI